MENGTNFLCTPLIRKYSIEHEKKDPKDVLTIALAEVVKKKEMEVIQNEAECQDWHVWLRGDGKPRTSIEEPLEQYTKEIIRAWEELRVQNAGKESGKSSISEIPTIRDLYKAVEVAKTNWETKQLRGFRIIKNRFCSFAGTMESYSYLFKVIPTGDKYFSLITGTVSSVIKVSANCDKAAEAFSSGLENLHKRLNTVWQELQIANTDNMKVYVIQLYVEVFKFLCEAMKWFMKKGTRFFKSFDSKYVDNIEGSVRRIGDVAEAIREEGAQVARARIGTISTDVGGIKNDMGDIKNDMGGMKNDMGGMKIQMNEFMNEFTNRFITMEERVGKLGMISLLKQPDPEDLTKAFGLILGSMAGLQLEGNLQQFSYNTSMAIRTQLKEKYSADNTYALSNGITLEAGMQLGYDAVDGVTSKTMYSKDEIKKAVLFLRAHIQDDKEAAWHSRRTSAQAGFPGESLVSLSTWIRAGETRFLWIEGPPDQRDSSLCMAAMQLCDVVLSTNLPCISFFGSQLMIIGEKSKQRGLVTFLYSILLQLIQLLPETFETVTDFHPSRFKQLDGTFASAGAALKIIADLNCEIQVVIMHWVLDGINLIEDLYTRPYLMAFIRTLHAQGKQTKHKVCFTTNGGCLLLDKSTSFVERVNATRTFHPGRALRGGVDVRQIGSYM